jgi:hypothetical protein
MPIEPDWQKEPPAEPGKTLSEHCPHDDLPGEDDAREGEEDANQNMCEGIAYTGRNCSAKLRVLSVTSVPV